MFVLPENLRQEKEVNIAMLQEVARQMAALGDNQGMNFLQQFEAQEREKAEKIAVSTTIFSVEMLVFAFYCAALYASMSEFNKNSGVFGTMFLVFALLGMFGCSIHDGQQVFQNNLHEHENRHEAVVTLPTVAMAQLNSATDAAVATDISVQSYVASEEVSQARTLSENEAGEIEIENVQHSIIQMFESSVAEADVTRLKRLGVVRYAADSIIRRPYESLLLGGRTTMWMGKTVYKLGELVCQQLKAPR